MPVFDAPITTNDDNIEKVLNQNLPVVLYLYDRSDNGLDKALKAAAKEYAGEILVVRVDVNEAQGVYKRFNRPTLPALFTLDEGEVESRAARIQPADVDAHVDFLMGQGPKPVETAAQTEAKAASGALPVHVTDRSFKKDVLQSDVPVLVDFWAPWCGPCHMVAPTLEKLAQQYAGRIKVAKLDVDRNQATARTYKAMSIPMLLMFKNGKIVGKLVGAQPQPNIERMIKQAL
jgi:thioredoxin 1